METLPLQQGHTGPSRKKSKLPIKVHIYPPKKDVLDLEFVKVINVNFNQHSKDLISLIPWRKIASLVHKDNVVTTTDIAGKKKVPLSKKSSSNLKLQQYHKDIRFTTGQCFISKDSLGVSLPAFNL
jgi:hypothetical protein